MVILVVLAFCVVDSVDRLLMASISGGFTAWLYRYVFVGDVIERR